MPYAEDLGGGSTLAGVLVASEPAGAVLGALLATRLLTPEQQVRAVPALAGVSLAALVSCGLFRPSAGIVAVLYVVVGVSAAVIVIAKARFVVVVPPAYRARAGGVASTGLVITQAIGLFGGGALAGVLPVPVVLAIFGAIGLLFAPVLVAASRTSTLSPP